MIIETKKCAGCETEKSLASFNKNSSRPDGVQHYCRTCANAFHVKYRKLHREELNKKNRDRNAKMLAAGRGSYATYVKAMSPERLVEFIAGKAEYREVNRDVIRERQAKSYRENAAQHILLGIKTKCKKYNIPFNIERSDIEAPEFCPVLGMKLERGFLAKRQGISPSVDRIIPSLGYVKGNVVVVSFRANRIKSDATLDELLKVAAFYKSLFDKSKAVINDY